MEDWQDQSVAVIETVAVGLDCGSGTESDALAEREYEECVAYEGCEVLVGGVTIDADLLQQQLLLRQTLTDHHSWSLCLTDPMRFCCLPGRNDGRDGD